MYNHWNNNEMYVSAAINIMQPLKQPQGLYSPSGKASYRQILWRLKAARLAVIMIVLLSNLTGI